ncbi:MAG: divalent-cation tolerance protein CutA [Verrucomicrobiae bacterium]|nr:divalent-cation tolerance protein CutA [Verrucomicrobiae bacterium]
MEEYLTAFVTVPDQSIADNLADALLTKRIVACVNILPPMQSRYWWKENIQADSEQLLIFKLPSKNWELFKDTVVDNHPYEVPEVIALPIVKGNESYLKWLGEMTNS